VNFSCESSDFCKEACGTLLAAVVHKASVLWFSSIMAKALEDMGIAGKNYLREALTNTTDPLGAIEEFQQENSILLPSLQPALPLLGWYASIYFQLLLFCENYKLRLETAMAGCGLVEKFIVAVLKESFLKSFQKLEIG